LQATITAIKSFSLEVSTRILTDQFLGETTIRKDDIYDGVRGAMVIQPEGQDLLILQNAIKERAQRRTAFAVSQVNITARLQFPNGQTPLLVVTDAKFGPMPLNIGARDAYVDLNLSYEADDYQLVSA
jgi:hypothetical protein